MIEEKEARPWAPGNDESFLLKYFFDGEYREWASGSTGAASEFIYIFSIWIKRYRRRQKYQALMNVTSVFFVNIALARRDRGLASLWAQIAIDRNCDRWKIGGRIIRG